ncbi:MAG: A/G-specific adenine glycosylase [Alphaproteobacteria bacterium]|nr:A/G-specific adenine glycosylase [Alphaproteobacteria bacterium]
MSSVAQKQLPLRPAGPATVQRLLDWYDAERRDLPWRTATGARPDAYRIWLSEIMLQQTTVKAVTPYYREFLLRWPTVKKLAAADLDEVLAAWAGLGYYTRARNLHKCAIVIATQYRGKFPQTERALIKLPGIGPYTAAAIAAIAFGEKTAPVDGNIERVVSRLFALQLPLPAAKPEIKRFAQTLVPASRPGDFAQALMDLGSGVCTPRRPSCLTCPLQPDCHASAKGIAEELPRKLAKPARPTRFGHAFVALREDGQILMRRRPDAGLLGGMLEVPSTDWQAKGTAAAKALRSAPVDTEWWPVPGTVIHTFTHFRLELNVFLAVVPGDISPNLWAEPGRCRWIPRRKLEQEAVPSVMRKIVAHALKWQDA